MALPVIDVPTFVLEVPGLDNKHKFRPFLVKEDKLLTLASASEDFKEMVGACVQVVENCSLGDLEVSNLAMYQLQWIFLKIKSKSVGDSQSFSLKCGKCEDLLNYEMDITDFKVIGNTEQDKKKIEISESSGLCLKYPSIEVQSSETDLTDLEIVLNCIDYIYNEEEIIRPSEESPEEILNFVENLPLDVYDEISSFFANIPTLGHTIEYDCPKCETHNRILINGHEHFFG